MNDLCNRLVKYTGIFYKTRSKFPTSSKLELYHAFVYSRVAYCIEVYGSAKASVLHPLQIMQNRILKILTCTPMRFPTNTLYSLWNVFKLSEIHLYKIYVLLFKYTNDKLPTLFKKIFNPNEQIVQKHTRQNKLFTVTRSNSLHGALLMNNYCTKLWNELPNDVTTITSQALFKKTLKEILPNRYS